MPRPLPHSAPGGEQESQQLAREEQAHGASCGNVRAGKQGCFGSGGQLAPAGQALLWRRQLRAGGGCRAMCWAAPASCCCCCCTPVPRAKLPRGPEQAPPFLPGWKAQASRAALGIDASRPCCAQSPNGAHGQQNLAWLSATRRHLHCRQAAALGSGRGGRLCPVPALPGVQRTLHRRLRLPVPLLVPALRAAPGPRLEDLQHRLYLALHHPGCRVWARQRGEWAEHSSPGGPLGSAPCIAQLRAFE